MATNGSSYHAIRNMDEEKRLPSGRSKGRVTEYRKKCVPRRSGPNPATTFVKCVHALGIPLPWVLHLALRNVAAAPP